MVPNKQWFNQSPMPSVAEVIRKVKLMEDLTPVEELVYLIYIEELSLEEAVKIVEANFDSTV